MIQSTTADKSLSGLFGDKENCEKQIWCKEENIAKIVHLTKHFYI